MKPETLMKFNRLVVDRITRLLTLHYKTSVPDNKQEIVSIASKFDTPDLNELVFALRRIEKGVFGQCVICRHDIPEDILESDLTARLCSSCQTALHERGESAR